MRITKEYNERRNEILDITEKLFHTKGYDRCTINDILKAVGIAKGTFYHYFKSKEEVLDAIVFRYKEIVVTKASKILEKDYNSQEEKLMHAFMAMNITSQIDHDVLDKMHKAENILMHQKILNQIVTVMAPILAKIIEEGIENKVWNCRFPLEYMQIFLASALTLTDEGIFQLDADSQMKVMAALISVLEKMLNVPEDSFMQLFMQNQGEM